MLIEYRIRYEKGELIITQRVECGGSTGVAKTANAEKLAQAPAAPVAPAAAPVAPAAAPVAPAAPAGGLESNSLGSSATGIATPPVYSGSSGPLIVIMGPVILTSDALEGGSGEGSTTGTDTTP